MMYWLKSTKIGILSLVARLFVASALPLFRMLGFKRFHILGCDSCLEDGAHHAYEQKENDNQVVVSVRIGEKVFSVTHGWFLKLKSLLT
jgi:hypothetical protein